MTQHSSAAGTQDWLKATKGMTILAYLEPKDFEPARENNQQPFSKADFDKSLKKVSRKIKK
jgi:hypothetical protein